jgi:hypothetical protein
MKVAIDEQALGIKANGVVESVANTPRHARRRWVSLLSRGEGGEHAGFLGGFSVRLSIPIETTKGAGHRRADERGVACGDGTSRVLVDRGGRQEYVTVKPGLSTGGYVEVNAPNGRLVPAKWWWWATSRRSLRR